MYDLKRWWAEAKYVYENDPAAKSVWEVFFLYPGIKALRRHSRAHKLYKKGKYFRARRISEKTKQLTGIEIHPGAQIGKNVMIDHGSGVVIGETCIIGDNVQLYQGVSLAADDFDRNGRRHPKVGNGALIGADALIVGPYEIGENSKVGAGAVVMIDVPDNTTAVGVPARLVEKKSNKKKEV